MKIFKKILVPIDFSADAEHALQFALELNKKLKSEISLFHSYAVPVYATDLPLTIPDISEIEKVAMDGLTKIKLKYQSLYPDSRIGTYISEGFAEDAISAAVEKIKADLIVMGTKGASGLREALIGTVTAAVIEHANCPVLTVPSMVKWTDVKKIVYATSYEEGDFGHVETVIDFAKALNAELILLHISTGKYDRTYEFDAIQRYKERLEQDTDFHKISIKLLVEEDVFLAISNYTDEVKADIIAMNLRSRSFMQKLFERSLTKRMAYHTHIPLFAFHSEK